MMDLSTQETKVADMLGQAVANVATQALKPMLSPMLKDLESTKKLISRQTEILEESIDHFKNDLGNFDRKLTELKKGIAAEPQHVKQLVAKLSQIESNLESTHSAIQQLVESNIRVRARMEESDKALISELDGKLSELYGQLSTEASSSMQAFSAHFDEIMGLKLADVFDANSSLADRVTLLHDVNNKLMEKTKWQFGLCASLFLLQAGTITLILAFMLNAK